MINQSVLKFFASVLLVLSSGIVRANEKLHLTKEEIQVLQDLISKRIIVKNPKTETLDLNELLKEKDLVKELESINSRNCTGDGPPF